MNDWTFVRDGEDWRGYSPDRCQRTRLKFSREWAVKDAENGRVQHLRGGVWVDEIDGSRNRYTMPAEVFSV